MMMPSDADNILFAMIIAAVAVLLVMIGLNPLPHSSRGTRLIRGVGQRVRTRDHLKRCLPYPLTRYGEGVDKSFEPNAFWEML
jgi:hypothetical protein